MVSLVSDINISQTDNLEAGPMILTDLTHLFSMLFHLQLCMALAVSSSNLPQLGV
jgi:hypothetical protein